MAKSRKPKQTKRYLDAFDPRYADSVARKQSLATQWPTYRPTDKVAPVATQWPTYAPSK